MIEPARDLLLRLMRVPPEPAAPFGQPGSLRVFRASRKLYLLSLVRWSFTQFAALAGIVFWIVVITLSEHEAERVRAQAPGAGAFRSLPAGHNHVTLQPLRYLRPTLFTWLWVAKGVGLAIYLSQLAISYAVLRLDFELRWYIVTDRSLRIRSGLWAVQELTMSFANLQQVSLTQGPLERLLGIANVRVESAGGGRHGSHHHDGKAQSMHSGIFHGVEKAGEIRDLILDRLRSFRDAGLGDPEEKAVERQSQRPPSLPPANSQEVLEAARELLVEVRKFRSALPFLVPPAK